MKQRTVVLFSGAGFSAPFGCPTMNEFFYYADEYLEEDDNAFLSGLLLEATWSCPDFGEQINVYSNENPVMARASGSCVIPKNRIGQS